MNPAAIQLARNILEKALPWYVAYGEKTALNEYEVHDAIISAELLGDAPLIELANRLIPFTPGYSAMKKFPLETLTEKRLLADITRLARGDQRLTLCLSGNYEAALELCKTPLDIEEVALTQACLGDIELALITAERPELEEFRRSGILSVSVIEAHRKERKELAERIFALLENVQFHAFQTTLGLLGARPWNPYPYPDW